MILTHNIIVDPNPEIRHLMGTVVLEDDLVAVMDYKVEPEQTHLRLFQKGKEVFTHIFQGEIIHFGTINKIELFILNPEKGEWIIFNSRQPKEPMKTGKFPFRSTSAFRARVHFFPESSSICIWEVGNFEQPSGQFSFLAYPPPANVTEKDLYVVKEENVFNHQVLPLNFKDRLTYFQGKVDDKIRWKVVDFLEKKLIPYEINKPENGAEYSLKHVAEMRPGVFLLSIEAMNPALRYVVYDSTHVQKPVKPFGTQLSDDVDSIISLGPWLFVLQFKVNDKGDPVPDDFTAYSKQTQQPVFKDSCLIVSGVDYFPNTANDNTIIRVESEYNCSKHMDIQVLRPTSQKELYVHLLQQITGGKMKTDMIQRVIDSFAE